MDLTRPDGSPLHVLVVDDEVNIAELIRFVGPSVSRRSLRDLLNLRRTAVRQPSRPGSR